MNLVTGPNGAKVDRILFWKGLPYQAVLELFTADCNLRCVYCAIQTDKADFPDYPRQSMTSDVLDHVRWLFARERPESINLCGNGETTILEGWTKICEPFLSFQNVSIISNLAKSLSREEADLLARCRTIMTSIDTSDAEILKEIRRRVQLRDIVFNLCKVKSAALLQGRQPPTIMVNCTVTTRTYKHLVQLVAFAAAISAGHIAFSDLFETETSVAHGIRSLASLDTPKLVEAAGEVREAAALAARNDIGITVSPRLSALLGLSMEWKIDVTNEDSAVLCFQPWDGFWVNSDGRVSYCCRHMGTTGEHIASFHSVGEILNHSNAVRLRRALLSGRSPERCRSCELGVATTPQRFRRRLQVREWSQRGHLRPIIAFARKNPLAQSLRRIVGRFL